MQRPRVAIIHNTIAPYRHPLFEQLSKKLDLTVYYCSMDSGLRHWDLWPRKYHYKYRLLLRIPLRKLHLNPSIVHRILRDRPGILVIGGYIDPTIWITLAMAKLLGIPVIYWTEGLEEPRSFLGFLTRSIRLFPVKEASAIVVPGGLSRKYVIGLGANEEKVFMAPNAVDNELFIRISSKFKLSKRGLRGHLAPVDNFVILCVSQLIERKGIEYLLQAYRKLKRERGDIALVLVGSGPQEQRLKDLADSLKLKDVKFLHSGFSLKELIKIYSSADVFVLPTLEDVWGLVINEAMACGLPVISTRRSQAALEMISQSENGYIVREADADALYSALKSLVYDKRLREEMGKRSLEIVTSRFGVRNMVNGFMEAIQYALAKS